MNKFLVCSLAALMLSGCKPTESGYKRAYERTVESRDDNSEPGYTSMSSELNMRKLIAGNDTVDYATAFVAITPGIGNPPAKLRPYCAVAGSFRQRFTAEDLCKRLIAAGRDSAFVLETGKPRYYVVAKSCKDAASAISEIKSMRADSIGSGEGFILRPARL